MTSGTNPLSLAALAASSPFCRLPATSSPGRGKSFEGRALGRTGEFRPPFVNGRKKPAVKLQTFRLCQSLSLSGEVARRSRDGEGLLPGRTLSVSLRSTALPRGKPQSLKARLELLPATLDAALQGRPLQPWLREPLSGESEYSLLGVRGRLATRSSSPVNGRKTPAVKLQTFRPCQSLSLSGEVARRSRDGEGLLPGRTLSVAYGDSSPEGRALGKEGKSHPYRSTTRRI